MVPPDHPYLQKTFLAYEATVRKKGYHGFPQKVDLEGDYVYDQKSAVRTMATSQAAVSLHAFMQEEFTMLGYLAIALGCGMIGYFLARKMF